MQSKQSGSNLYFQSWLWNLLFQWTEFTFLVWRAPEKIETSINNYEYSEQILHLSVKCIIPLENSKLLQL